MENRGSLYVDFLFLEKKFMSIWFPKELKNMGNKFPPTCHLTIVSSSNSIIPKKIQWKTIWCPPRQLAWLYHHHHEAPNLHSKYNHHRRRPKSPTQYKYEHVINSLGTISTSCTSLNNWQSAITDSLQLVRIANVITNNHHKNTHHLWSGESDWHPLPQSLVRSPSR